MKIRSLSSLLLSWSLLFGGALVVSSADDSGCGGGATDEGSDDEDGDGEGTDDDNLDNEGDGDDEEIAGCSAAGPEASTGPCLVAQLAGTYNLSATTGTHDRGTITIGEDGSVDYDTDLDFETDIYAGVYDRLECCSRISVEMNQQPENDTNLAEDARHRVDLFLDAADISGDLERVEYYPNWPSSEGKVVADVQ